MEQFKKIWLINQYIDVGETVPEDLLPRNDPTTEDSVEAVFAKSARRAPLEDKDVIDIGSDRV